MASSSSSKGGEDSERRSKRISGEQVFDCSEQFPACKTFQPQTKLPSYKVLSVGLSILPQVVRIKCYETLPAGKLPRKCTVNIIMTRCIAFPLKQLLKDWKNLLLSYLGRKEKNKSERKGKLQSCE